jgi:hypothetical protein
MRLTALLLMTLTVTYAESSSTPDLTGVWVADPARSDIEMSPFFSRLILNIAQDGKGLRVIEVVSGVRGSSVAERHYLFNGPVRSFGSVGAVKNTGRTTILRCSDRLERWSISADGSELIVNRSIGDTIPTSSQRSLVFRRSSRTVEE